MLNSQAGREQVSLARKNNGGSGEKPELDLNWASGISDEEWSVYLSAIEALRGAGVQGLVGGGFAQASYTGRWRNTKDIDFFIQPADRERAVSSLLKVGFEDYYTTLPYDRSWIYRSSRSGVIVDLIWQMANHRAEVDETWLAHSMALNLRGQSLRLLPLEELVWCKLYVFQRDRCDWIDVINLVYTNGPSIEWNRLIQRLGPDVSLLRALLTLYGWLHAERALLLPDALRQELGVARPNPEDAKYWRERARWLDSRVWFTALSPRGDRLEI